jgi:hypothetical protein
VPSILDKRINEILKQSVTPVLKREGFGKKGLVYSSDRGPLCWLVDIQKSRWNDPSEARFTLNCGIYVRGVLTAYANRPDRASPRIEDCCISARVGLLAEEAIDVWWKLMADDDAEGSDSIIGDEVRERIERCLLPFLREFETVEQVAAFLDAPIAESNSLVSPQSEAQRHSYAAVLYSQLGEARRRDAALQAAESAAAGSPIEGIVTRLKERLL